MNPNDRTKSYDGGQLNPTVSSIDVSGTERERRIRQREAILEDPDLPHQVRERAYNRIVAFEREADDDD